MASEKRAFNRVSSSPKKKHGSSKKKRGLDKFVSKSINLPVNNLLGDKLYSKLHEPNILKTKPHNTLLTRPKNITSPSRPVIQKSIDENSQLDQIYWSGDAGNKNGESRLHKHDCDKKDANKPSINDENDEIEFRRDMLPDFRLDPISQLEKKYNTNLNMSNQQENSIKNISTQKFSSLHSFSPIPDWSSSSLRKSGIREKSKSLSLNSSKLFARIGSDGKLRTNSSHGNGDQPRKSSLQEILSELKSTEKDNNMCGNTTSEILDKGISINDYQRDDFSDDFFDELANSKANRSVGLEKRTSKPVVDNNDEFNDEFSSDDDFDFNELEKKLDMKSQPIVVSAPPKKPLTMSFNDVVQSTPSKLEKTNVIENIPNNQIANTDSNDITNTTSFDDSGELDYDDSEEERLLSRFTFTQKDRQFSTQQENRIKNTDLLGAAIFSKDINSDGTEETKNFKDSLKDVNLAKIAIKRSWLHRFEVLEVHEKSYNLKGVKKNQIILKVKDKDSKIRNLVVRESWLLTTYDVGEVIHVVGENPTVIDNDHNYLILNPDTLISATTMGESLNCERKSSLLARFNLPGESSKPLIVGNIVHGILQECMVSKSNSSKFIETLLKSAIHRNLIEILGIGETEQSIYEECQVHIGYIKDWVGKYIFDSDKSSISTFGKGETSKFSISKTLDIEESIWSPIFGLRGLIDATIESSLQDSKKSGKFIAPLEIKTGKEYLSHKAQTSLYTLLMRDRYEMDVNFFILVYTKFSQTTKYEIDRRDLRMLLIKRNSISKFLKEIQPQLPPLAKNSMCDRCFVKETCMLFNKLGENGSEEDSGFQPGEFLTHTEHIAPEYGDYYKYWEDLLNKEENFINKLTKEIWIFTGEEREKSNGKAISGLKIKDVTYDASTGYYTYAFERKSQGTSYEYPSMTWSQVATHDHVIVSDENGHFAICFGFVSMIRENLIKITTQRRLDHSNSRMPNFDVIKNQSFQSVLESDQNLTGLSLDSNSESRVYRIDKNPAFHGLKLARYNLLELFSKDSNGLMRDILVKKRKTDPSPVPLIDYKLDQSRFNEDQLSAMKKVFSTNDFSLILGMPGTGKTTIITEIIQQLVKNGKTVLIASYTHSAIDNILIKLKEQKMVDFVRLGSLNKIHPLVKEFSPLSDNFDIKDSQGLYDAYRKPSVVATTCLGVTDWVFNTRKFDYCIIDEASQVAMPVCIGPIRFCDRFILVGDHYQLPPLITAPSARKGLSKSLFRMLSEDFPDSVGELAHQYRMCEDIMLLSNTLIYNGRLKCGSNLVSRQRLKIPRPEQLQQHITKENIRPEHDWIKNIVFKETNRVIFLNHDTISDAKERTLGDKVDNPVEGVLIYEIVESLLACGVHESSIGVMSLYRAQIRLLTRKLYQRKDVEILTADRFQGLDKDCIIISLVRSNEKQMVGELLKEWRRINVAITRAKSKLIILGSRKTLKNLATIEAFMNIIESRGWLYDLPSNAVQCYEFFLQEPNSCSLQKGDSNSRSPQKSFKEKTKLSKKLLDNHLLLKNIVEESKSS
ncbi:bifunctional ATP-dependent DNA helicase/ssDNA endodeoxyribonuclease [Saccharomycopsis crataegensis]|uniref:DNA replication ATP-dependent helicase/nuclease n=1 Tax=Saccharomycopsis crataegensis TaxID=43959 RepID=A0AAV5QUU9_9ASCO|nr:bifunctional ATP-dependent DNA helicase/ssDNA endodeoxyribonuclease [Saccharomycopsis crataegensis]